MGIEDEISRREAEFRRLQDSYRMMQQALSRCSSARVVKHEPKQASAAEQSAALPRCRSLPTSQQPSTSEEAGEVGAGGSADTEMVDFMARQLEALLAEKARLAEENARLLRENDSLQDMLSMSISFEEEDEGGCEDTVNLPASHGPL